MEKKLTIHFFVQTVIKHGTFFRYHNWAIGLTNMGHKVKVFTASYTKNDIDRVEVIDGIEYHITACYFPFQSIFGQTTHPYAGLKRMKVKYGECDIAHLFQPHISAYLPWYYNKKKAKQNVFDWDDLWTDGLVKKGKKLYDKWFYRQVKFLEGHAPKIANYTTTCSHFLSNRAANAGATKTEIVYNGFWQYIPNNKKVSRAKTNLMQDAFYMGFMGRTSHVSEMIGCFELLKEASKIIPNIRLALCGMPAEVLKNADESILNRIDYLGYLAPLDTRDFASSLDIGLLPLEDNDFNESRFPIKFSEYLAANIPMLCSDVGECAFIASKFNFVKIAGKDNNDWVKNGLEVLSQINNQQYPLVEREIIVKNLSWDSICNNLSNIYFTGKQ